MSVQEHFFLLNTSSMLDAISVLDISTTFCSHTPLRCLLFAHSSQAVTSNEVFDLRAAGRLHVSATCLRAALEPGQSNTRILALL